MGVQFNFSTYDFPVFPAPLIALNVLGFLVKYKLTINGGGGHFLWYYY